MKTIAPLIVLFGMLSFTGSAFAREAHGGRPKAPTERPQNASGLQPATSLETASLGTRLSDDEWRKRFPLKETPPRR